jgi:uncharacterized membrane protein YqjE
MNLDELKILWTSQEESMESERVSRDEVLSLLAGNGRSALSRINRNILIEMGVVALFGVLWIFMLVSKATPPSGLEITGVFLYVILSALFYRWKFTSLNAAKLKGKNLKVALQHTVGVMGRFMRIYYWAGWILVPVLGSVSFLYSVFSEFQESGIDPAMIAGSRWAMIIGVMLLYNVIAVIFVKWYVQKLYGKHYQILQDSLAELEEDL